MSSQLVPEAAYLESDFASYAYPLIHAGAAPICPPTYEPRPPKRIRLDTQTLITPNSHHQAESPWQSATTSAVDQHVSFHQFSPPDRSTSVPPEPPKRGRKKKIILPPADPFILEDMPFPEHQPWLKVKPRQRRAAVPVVEDQPVLPPASQAPNEGETLVLDKHADRIAALIAQKRKENETKQFRQRMALQQRLHRGEKDQGDQVIAASHVELKRKMELSARGIFEEAPPDGNELEFKPVETSSITSSDRSETDESVSYSIHRHVPPAYESEFAPPDQREGEDGSDVEELDDSEPVYPVIRRDDSPGPILGAYVHSNQPAYYQRTMLTTSVLSISNRVPPSNVANQIYAPTPLVGQYADNVHTWNASQPWTAQMFHALPSTQTPELERAQMAQSRPPRGSHESTPHETGFANGYTQAFDPVDILDSAAHSNATTNSSSSSTPAAGNAHMHNPTNLPQNFSSALDTETPVLRSNMNMFTRQARENGVIGGNNNVILPTAARRNMFDKRV